MGFAVVYSRATRGIEAPLVTVEVHITNGLPGMSIVGLPATAVKESRDRVRSALINSRFEIPIRRITINLAPADLPKEGGAYDLAIAIGILAASQQIPTSTLTNHEFLGELALNGELRPIRAALPAALAIQKANRQLIIAAGNTELDCLPSHYQILPAKTLLDVTGHLSAITPLPELLRQTMHFTEPSTLDLIDVKGQTQAKRALEIAAAGGHSLLFVGPPGTGKSMLSSRLPTIMPPLTEEQALSVAALYSVANQGMRFQAIRPYRAPHHTASAIALIGGGRPPQPGEVSLAHHGVLFLDELPEFGRHVLEVLREPIESGVVHISRAACQAEFPAEFQLICAMNPCPCGYYGDGSSRCHCSSETVTRYQNRISGPLLDRIDIQTAVCPVPRNLLLEPSTQNSETSVMVRSRVIQAFQKQWGRQGKVNARITQNELQTYCQLTADDRDYLLNSVEKLGLSARAFYRILKVSRTIADLANAESITRQHLQESLSFRKQISSTL